MYIGVYRPDLFSQLHVELLYGQCSTSNQLRYAAAAAVGIIYSVLYAITLRDIVYVTAGHAISSLTAVYLPAVHVVNWPVTGHAALATS